VGRHGAVGRGDSFGGAPIPAGVVSRGDIDVVVGPVVNSALDLCGSDDDGV
jgi:hypothetical protein